MSDAEHLLEARRLHPTTLVLRLLASIPGLILLTLPVWTGGDRSVLYLVFFSAVYALFAVPMIVAHYMRFRYWINPKEVVIQSGVFTRQHRSIPIERIQNIEIRQSLLPRMFGTARVQIETAGSKSAEGLLELVSLAEARNIREVVRAYQRGLASQPADAPQSLEEGPAEAPTEEGRQLLIALSIRRVLLSGVFRFSLIYIALIFSGLQFLNIDVEDIFDWYTRGRLEWMTEVIADSPWLIAIFSALTAAVISWIIGILVNLNRYYGFRLALEGDKLFRRHGLLTVLEGTIPIKKVQAVLLRANPLMRRYGFRRMELQTMGVDADQQGNQVAVPFAREQEIEAINPHVLPFSLPETFFSVSRLMIRRSIIRYSGVLLLIGAPLGYFWAPGYWLFAIWPLLPVLAYLQYKHHGYAFDGNFLFVRRGIILHTIWVLPVERFQVLYGTASIFQRRLGLATVLVDTAGATSVAAPEIRDLPEQTAMELLESLYLRFQEQMNVRVPPLPYNRADAAAAREE
jgi:putative membrane protein